MAMLRPDNLFLIFGAILLLLASISVINFTSKFIFGLVKTNPTIIAQHIYDPDVLTNTTLICPFAANTYQARYNQTVCFNKTLHYRYIPWIRFDVWKTFRELNEEKKKRLAKELELMKSVENEVNETHHENSTENENVIHEASANRKDKEEPSKVVCTILASLLVVSSIFAVCEVFKDKCLSQRKNSPRVANQKFSFDGDSIAHLRSTYEGQRQEAFQSAKVTQTLVHQTSLDRAISKLSSEVKPFYLRRGSVPTQMTYSGVKPSNPQDSSYNKEMHLHSSDIPDIRRGSRHIIRRH